MKPGLKEGDTAEVEVVVDKSMVASFGGQTVHDLYSTSSLINHMEWAARKLILPYLEEQEEGMGCHISVSHRSLTLLNMKVTIRATVTDIRENKIECEVEAFNSRTKIARGTIVQAIVQKQWLEKKMKEVSLVETIARDATTTKV